MPGTYSQILLHIVFSTKRRYGWITDDVAKRLYPYIGGIVRAEGGTLFDMNGIQDHVHLYLRIRPDMRVSDLMRVVKARSSKWIHETFPERKDFAWQEGYSVFSVSKQEEGKLKKYIADQHEHHRNEQYTIELVRMLYEQEIEFDAQFLFD